MAETYCRNCYQLKLLTRRQSETIRKLETEIKERCQSYLMQIAALKQNNNNIRVHTNHKNSQERPSDKLVVSSSCSDTQSQYLLANSDCFTISTVMKIQIGCETKIERYEEKNKHDQFLQTIIDSLKLRISEIQKSKNDFQKELELVRDKLKEVSVSYEVIARYSEKNYSTLKNQNSLLAQYETAFALINSEIRSYIDAVTVSPLQIAYELMRIIKKYSKVEFISVVPKIQTELPTKYSYDYCIQYHNEKLRPMTPERRQRDEKLFARSESTALEDRNEFKLRSHMFHSHHIISPLEAPYFVYEDIGKNVENGFIKRNFIRKKIVRRSVSVAAFRPISKDKESLKYVLFDKLNELRLNKQNERKRFRQYQDPQRVSELSRYSDISKRSYSDGDEYRVVYVNTSTPTEQYQTTKIYKIRDYN